MLASKKIQAQMPDRNINIHKKNLFDFYRFMYERQMVWYKRFILKQKPPWIKDKILANVKFTNVYRELDRGTIWLLENIFKSAKHKEDIVFAVVAYRILNRAETFETIGYIPISTTPIKKVSKDLYKIRNSGKPVMTNAHSTPPAPKGKTKIDGYLLTLKELKLKLPHIMVGIHKAKGLKDVFNQFVAIKRIGGFYAYEIICDLMYLGIIPFNEDDWVNVGPGAKGGVTLIFPNRDYITHYDALIRLRDLQDMAFKKLKLKFPYYNGKKLTLRCIEHSLCEFFKYWLIQRNLGRARIKVNTQQMYKNSKKEKLPMTGVI